MNFWIFSKISLRKVYWMKIRRICFLLFLISQIPDGKDTYPKRKIVGLDVNLPKERILDEIEELTHSRVVVYDGEIDNVLGIIRIREYLKQYLNTGELPELRDVMDEPYWVSSKTMADELLEEMSQARQNIALVRGVNGKFIGLVSIEDILEELVGDIFDESDEEGGGSK